MALKSAVFTAGFDAYLSSLPLLFPYSFSINLIFIGRTLFLSVSKMINKVNIIRY